MSGKESEDVNVNLSSFLEMVRRLVAKVDQLAQDQKEDAAALGAKIDKVESNLSDRINRLDKKMFGNGDMEEAVVTQVRDNTHAIRRIESVQNGNSTAIKDIQQFITAIRGSWKIVAAMLAGAWAVSLIILSVVLSLVVSHFIS